MNGEETCKHVIDDLDDFRRGQLNFSRREFMEKHLEQCESCRTELASREALARQMIAALPSAQTPRDLSLAVRTSIKQAGQKQPGSVRKRSTNLLPGMLTAAAVLLITIAAIYLKPGKSPQAEIASSAPQTEVSSEFFQELTESTRGAEVPAAMSVPVQSNTSEYGDSRRQLEPPSAVAASKAMTFSDAPAADNFALDAVPSSRSETREKLRRSVTDAAMKAESDSPAAPASRAPVTTLGTMQSAGSSARWSFGETKTGDFAAASDKSLVTAYGAAQETASTATLTSATLTTQSLATTLPALITTVPLSEELL